MFSISLLSSITILVLSVLLYGKVKNTRQIYIKVAPFIALCDLGVSVIMILWSLKEIPLSSEDMVIVSMYLFFVFPQCSIFLTASVAMSLQLVFVYKMKSAKYLKRYSVFFSIFFSSFLMFPFLMGSFALEKDNGLVVIKFMKPGSRYLFELFAKVIPYLFCIVYCIIILFQLASNVIYKDEYSKAKRIIKLCLNRFLLNPLRTIIYKCNNLKEKKIPSFNQHVELEESNNRLHSSNNEISELGSWSFFNVHNRKAPERSILSPKRVKKSITTNKAYADPLYSNNIGNERTYFREFESKKVYARSRNKKKNKVEDILCYKENEKKAKHMLKRLALFLMVPLVTQLWQRVDMFLYGIRVVYVSRYTSVEFLVYSTFMYLLLSLQGTLNLIVYISNPTIFASLKLLVFNKYNVDLGVKESRRSELYGTEKNSILL
ncbi:hypothetical protein BB560_001054 [Smittium megazygosporum]|uniref:G-protein coupled receptors family 1 profile domain-containing protein n=1 Tax=Smittium megazygosporum TaxID=133381 RepID=A0A2T9ZIM6_9FUNG|nr:hypothetical protein BB560_001054 [Smittium megazygosporum]